MIHHFFIPVEPMGKPRMTRKDKWAKRPCVERYWAFKDALRVKLKEALGELPAPEKVTMFSWVAYFVPPKSWKKKKREDCIGTLHRQKPDRDNVDKAILDAIFDDDSKISVGTLKKVWGRQAGILISFNLEE